MVYRKYLKRVFDIIGSCVLLLILSPILFIIGVAVKVKLGSPVIYVQERPGYQERIFKLYKFRSMKEAKDKEGKDLSDEERLTSFGKKLRASSLDELPELYNILKGDMSFVGPRPLLVEYLSLYNEKHRQRHDVRPGLTGYAQVMGRNSLSWEEKFDLDIAYLSTISLLFDLKILGNTISKVLRRDGIAGTDSETMKRFVGYDER
jgi:lipopolysaccharide/colanic/teichoic acid biosynthesis glycosyltransferase